jgi:hypothetical protein
MLSVCVSLFISGCGEQKAPATQAPAVQPPVTSQPEAARPADEAGESYLARFKFKTGDGSEALSIKRYKDHDKIELSFEGTNSVFKGRTEVADRVKYKEVAGEAGEKQLVAEVKIKPDSVKLVDEKEALIWKVRFNDDKIKISDNEDGNNSCEIKIKSADKGEIRDQSGNEIGNVRFYSDNGKLKVKDAAGAEILVTKDSQFSLAPGVILFKHIPLAHRAIIISEILRRGR